ncbi:DUF2382 domain-containing protein [Cellulomonas marina]|uniref:Conserved domain-containing protein n=1 Tax=Cellulomonas marina TaxID=988821 RepID=A0A1I0YIB9_9CELL|nr:DUF2382 domain-containing protein [Cellulomonas marina]SFB12098.1 conserved domain-containing protein [Cellulomonas marina]
MDQHHLTAASPDRAPGVPVPGAVAAADRAEVLRSEERAVAGVERVPVARVVVGKRVVVEERTVTVQVRREELVVEERPLVDGDAPGTGTGGTGPTADDWRLRVPDQPVLDLVLSEEEVEVVTRVVPRERVRVHVDAVRSTVEVPTTLAREVVEVDADGAAAHARDEDERSPDVLDVATGRALRGSV